LDCRFLKTYTSLKEKEEHSKKCAELSLKKFKKEYETRVCVKSLKSRMSLGNRIDLSTESDNEKFYSKYRAIVDCVTVAILYFMLILLGVSNYSSTKFYDREYTTVQDYTVVVKGLPHGEDVIDGTIIVKDLLHKKIEQIGGYKVTQINLVYDTEEYLKMRENYILNRQKMSKNNYNQNFLLGNKGRNGDNMALFDKENLANIIISEQIKEIEDDFDTGYPKGMTGVAFVSFETA
jgi:hypothetical protein